MERPVEVAPHRCEVSHDARVVRGRGVFVVESLGTGRSRVTWTEEPDA